jgi:hypothetical protein
MFQKIVNFWFSSFITERLLASPLFNRMAATTHKHVSSVTNQGKLNFLCGNRILISIKGAKTGNDFIKAFKDNLEKEARNSKK